MPKVISTNPADLIERLVRAYGSHEGVSRATGFPIRSLFRWKSGESTPSYRNYMKLVAAVRRVERNRAAALGRGLAKEW